MSEISRRRFRGAPLLAHGRYESFMADYRIIDPHVHVWKHDPQYPFAEGAHVPDRDATPETLLDLMKANGVSKTVIIQVIHYRYDNRFLADVLKRYPARFRASAAWIRWIPPRRTILSQLTEQGFRGVRLSPAGNASGDWFRGPLMPPLWKRCHELKVPMTVLAPIARMPEVGALLEKLPDLTVVIDHMADCPVDQPAELEKLIALKRYPQRVRQDLAYVVAFEAAVSVAGCAGAREAAAPGVRSAAADVGDGLADHRTKPRHLRAGFDGGAGRDEVPERGRSELDAE